MTFFAEPLTHPNDADGNPAYAPLDPVNPTRQRMTRWSDMGPKGHILRGEHPQWVWMHPATNWKRWDLSGPREGTQGVVMATGVDGFADLDFEHRYSEGPYMVGAERERTDYRKTQATFGVWINPPMNPNRMAGGPMALQKIEDSWRQSWSDTVPGFLGCFTRTHGWRFLPLIKGSGVKAEWDRSPTAHGNNTALHNMTVDAPWPLFAKRAIVQTWAATLDDIDAYGVATHVFAIPNRGTWRAHPKFIVKGHGDITIGDGNAGRDIEMPEFVEADGGYMLIDTDPARPTITTEAQPVDNALYRFMRNSQFLELLLGDELSSTLPAQRRIPGGVEFDNPIPERTVAHIRVTHSNPQGSIACIMPQYFRAAWS